MPRKDIILNLPGFSIKKVSGYNPLVLHVHYRNIPRCVYCNGLRGRERVKVICIDLSSSYKHFNSALFS